MNHEKLREQVHQGIDRQCASLTSDPYRVQRILNAAEPEGGKIVVRRIPRFVVVLAVLLVLGMSTAIAAGVLPWNLSLEDMLRVTEETKEYYWHTELFDSPGVSVTQGDVTITLEESIVDTHAAYFAFRVKGWQPPEGKEPTFASAEYDTRSTGMITAASDSFFNGLVSNGAGVSVYPDGSVPEDYSAVSYVNEDGELVYTISIFSGCGDLIGETMTVTLTDLGVYTDKQGNCEVHVPGTWTFKWELKGTDHHWKFRGLAKDIGTTEATITAVELSPIHIRLVMNVELTLLEYRNRSDREDFVPRFYGVKMKDGTVYEAITEAGFEGYDSPDPDGKVYQMLYSLNRVIEPSNVESLLFSYTNENGELETAEVRHNSLD